MSPWVSAGLRARLLRALRSAALSLGLPGALGAAVGLLCLVTVIFVLPAVQLRNESLRAEADQARVQALRRLASAAAGPGPANMGTPQQVFTRSFPDAATRHARLERLLLLATRHGLKVQRSELAYSLQPELGLGAYRVQLPVSAPFAALHAFWADALRLDGALSLDSVSLQRHKPEDELLRADLVFSMHVRADSMLSAAASAAPSAAASAAAAAIAPPQRPGVSP